MEKMGLICLENDSGMDDLTVDSIVQMLIQKLKESDEFVTAVSNSFKIENNVFLLVKLAKREEELV